MTAAWLVVGWVVLVLAIVLLVAWWGCKQPTPPVRDSELPSTTPLDGGPEPTRPQITLHPGWANTVPSGSMPLDEAPWDQAVQTMNAKERKP